MKHIDYLKKIVGLFEFRVISDKRGNEFVLLADNMISNVDFVEDKTAFEASENHVHIINNIKKDDMESLVSIGKILGETLTNILKVSFPEKEFMVFVSLRLNDSMIIRFHQRWQNELPYCNPEEFRSENEKVFLFTTETNQSISNTREYQ